ncbi:hypothetical protein [Rhodococcus sp. A14]|uniref:hypothetical protein n=1 Tax=Rhodococcus sp. A14 TaxID=1194106 RepID=UPI00197CD416
MTERYNGRPPQTRVIPAGTGLHRISGTGSPYPPNSFNATGIRTLGDPLQGRFEPIDDSHGGYLYVALSQAGAVAEGILRDIPIPRSGIVRRKRFAGKTHLDGPRPRHHGHLAAGRRSPIAEPVRDPGRL